MREYPSTAARSFTSTPASRNKQQQQQQPPPPPPPSNDLFARALEQERLRREAASGKTPSSTPPPSPSASSTQRTAEEEGDLDEDLTPEEQERKRRWKEAQEKKEAKKIKEGGRTGILLTLAVGVMFYGYLGLPAKGEDDSDQSFAAHNKRVWENITKSYKSSVEEPASEKLLPDPLPQPYQRPYTLCVELNDALVHLVWDVNHGWRVATRPGVKQFLAYLSRYFEIVLYTSSQNYVAQPVVDTLDPYAYIMYKLYRDATRLVDGKYVKDISCINRDESKVILLDTDKDSFKLQPDNGILLKPWKGEKGDTELPKMMKFLEEIALLGMLLNVQDLRPLLKAVKSVDEDVVKGWAIRKEQLRADFDEYNRKQNPTSTSIFSSPSSSTSSSSNILTSVVNTVKTSLFGRGLQTDTAAAPAGGMSTTPTSTGKSTNLINVLEQAAQEEFVAFEKEQEETKKKMDELKKKQEEEIRAMMEKKLKLADYMMGQGQPGAPVPQQA
ncbi:mitochondrial inner membrane protein required for protein import [Chytridiales sp. JEL 0842]|nr:mitochondrial inner membrane protein required for protein import [Chytridiales sp. JEL 0842]